MGRDPNFGGRFREYFLGLKSLFALAALLIPASPSVAIEPLPVREIAPGIFVHQGRYEIFTPRNSGDTSNAGFIVGRDGVAVIDTGGSPRVGAALLAAIRERTSLPIRYVINTHMHPDHIFGNVAFEGENPQFVGHAKLPRALAARADRYLGINRELLGEAFDGTRILPPTALVKDRLELDLGDRKLLVEAHPTAHTDNDVTVFDGATGTLFLGDLLFARHVPALDGSIRGWLTLLDGLATRTDIKRAIPGHGPEQMSWPAAIAAEKRYLTKIAEEVRAMIKEGRTLAEAADTAGLSEKDAWLLFKEYHARNISAAFAELEWE
ncbi:MAG TPA: quinoprotein relay system zinc metallohydrolase 2 [Hyphomicrobium sp.]|nr:quinoprotein relay system zinc metallohydrolase 2 [Hyphomicrobium sp.]